MRYGQVQRGVKAALLAAMLVALGSPARADIIFSNFVDDPSLGIDYLHYSALAFGGGLGGPSTLDMAMPFTVSPESSFDLTQIEMALEVSPFTHSASFPAVVRVKLLEDSGGLPSAMVPLAEWLLEDLWFDDPDQVITPAQTISGITGITLQGGSRYWLAASVVDPLAQIRWWVTDPSHLDGFAGSRNNGDTWSFASGTQSGAFEVEGTPTVAVAVPEPGTLGLFLVGLIGSGRMRRRQRQSLSQQRR